MYKLELVNKKTKEVTIFDDIVDINYGEKLFFNFEINATQLADGEYTLSLYEDGKLISTDTLCVGDFDVVGLQYKKGEAIYIETKLETKTQDKSVELSDIATTIIPDEDYDAMTTVQVNAQPVYDGAYNVGHTEGYESGIRAQKEKLESIEITANGVYSKEDGYNNIVVEVPDVNGSYDEGYDAGYSEGVEEGTSNAGAIIAETAQVLNITENGTYTTDYSKIEDIYDTGAITGYFDDNTPFYGYANLNDISFKTNFTTRSRIELWWKSDGLYKERNNCYGICGEYDNDKTYSIHLWKSSGKVKLCGKIGKQIIKTEFVNNKWYHLILSFDEGFVVNGEKIGDFNIVSGVGGELDAYINETYYNYDTYGRANGYFGMVKLDDNIFIPTENGFINYTTNTPLEVHREGTYEYSEISPIEGNLIRTVNVNILPKINIEQEGITFAYFKGTNIPEWADWSGITNMERMFSNSTIAEIPVIDTSNVTNMSNMFYNCSNITTIPKLDTSNITSMNYMFYNCNNLESLPPLNAGKVTIINYFFGYTNLTAFTDFGGLIGLKTNWSDNYSLNKAPNLSYESCINVLNGLYDFTGNGETPTSSQGKLKVNSNFLSLVGDEISIGTNKGWTITA